MAKPDSRSVNAELRIGATEGGEQRIGKDWGGPGDLRSRPPVDPSLMEDVDSIVFDRI